MIFYTKNSGWFLNGVELTNEQVNQFFTGRF